MFNIGDVVLGDYGMKYVIAKVNRATYDVCSLSDVERGYAMQLSRYPMNRLDRYKLINHIDFTPPQEPAATPYNPGDILYNSWGWEQTNIDFYQVVKSSDKTVTIRPIGQNQTYNAHSMTGTCVPIKDSFIGEPSRRAICMSQGKQFVTAEYGVMNLWDGKPKEYSCYA